MNIIPLFFNGWTSHTFEFSMEFSCSELISTRLGSSSLKFLHESNYFAEYLYRCTQLHSRKQDWRNVTNKKYLCTFVIRIFRLTWNIGEQLDTNNCYTLHCDSNIWRTKIDKRQYRNELYQVLSDTSFRIINYQQLINSNRDRETIRRP